jgi:hypothetical protein
MQSFESQLMYWGKMLPPSSRLENKESKKSAWKQVASRCRQHVPLKCWLAFNGLYSIIFQEKELFVIPEESKHSKCKPSEFLSVYYNWVIFNLRNNFNSYTNSQSSSKILHCCAEQRTSKAQTYCQNLKMHSCWPFFCHWIRTSHQKTELSLWHSWVNKLTIFVYVVCPKRNRTFFLKHILISLQLNKTCLLQRTPLHCLYTASKVFSSSWTRFAG